MQKVLVNFNGTEYNPDTKSSHEEQLKKESLISKYILKSGASKVLDSVLVNEKDAQILANRWSMLLENSFNTLTFTTKLQGVNLQTNDVIQIRHPKFFDRFFNEPLKIMIIESISKKADGVEITAIDLSGAISRVCKINDLTTNWETSSDSQKMIGGFYVGENKTINDDPTSALTNLIW